MKTPKPAPAPAPRDSSVDAAGWYDGTSYTQPRTAFSAPITSGGYPFHGFSDTWAKNIAAASAAVGRT